MNLMRGMTFKTDAGRVTVLQVLGKKKNWIKILNENQKMELLSKEQLDGRVKNGTKAAYE